MAAMLSIQTCIRPAWPSASHPWELLLGQITEQQILAEIPGAVLAEVSARRRVQPPERILSSATVDVLRCNGPEARPAWTCR